MAVDQQYGLQLNINKDTLHYPTFKSLEKTVHFFGLEVQWLSYGNFVISGGNFFCQKYDVPDEALPNMPQVPKKFGEGNKVWPVT